MSITKKEKSQKGIRKICASLLSVVMAMSMIPAASYAATTTVRTPANTIKGLVFEEQGTLAYSSDYAYTGERSLHITTDSQESFILLAKNYFKSGATYDIEYYINIISGDRIYTRLSWDNESNARIYDKGIKTGQLNSKTMVEAVNGAAKGTGQWYKVTLTNYSGGGTDAALGLFSFVGAGEAYIDDLKIKCNTPGYIVPSNPSSGFEEYVDGTGTFPTSFDKFTKVTQADNLPMTKGAYEVSYSNFAYEGKRSMYVNTMRSHYTGTNKSLYIGNHSDLGLVNGKEYVMKFNIYPVNFAKTGGMYVSAHGNNRAYFQANGNNYIYPNNKNTFTRIESGSKAGWYQYEWGFTCGGTWEPQFLIVEAAAEFYMDNIEFYEKGSTTPVKRIDFEKEYPAAQNLIASQASGTEISVSWRNPISSQVEKISLYDVTNDTLLKDNFDLTADKMIEYISTDFAEGVEQIYRLDVEYDDSTVKSQIVGIMPSSKGWEYNAGSWKIVSSKSTKPPVMSYVDDTVYKTAAPSLKVVSNEDELNVKDALLEVKPETKLDVNKTYRLTGWVKGDNVGYIWERVMTASGGAAAPYRLYQIHNKWNQYLTFDWKSFTVDLKPDSEDAFAIIFTLSAGVKNFYIDDVSLYELDGSTPVGSDLMGTRGTIDDVKAAPAVLEAGNVKNGTNEVRLRWTAEEDAKYVAVYDKANTSVPVAFVPASMGYVDIPNLEGGSTYTYVLKAVNDEGRESASGVEVVAEPKAIALIVGDFEESKSGNDVTVSIDVKNNGYDDGVSAQLILGVYRDEYTLTNINTSDAIVIAKKAPSDAATPLTCTVTVPNGYYLKAYLWDSIEGMKPLRTSKKVQY